MCRGLPSGGLHASGTSAPERVSVYGGLHDATYPGHCYRARYPRVSVGGSEERIPSVGEKKLDTVELTDYISSISRCRLDWMG